MDTRSIGAIEEDYVVNALIKSGHILIDRNKHLGKIGEIDIISRKGNYLYFIEVKSKRTAIAGFPSDMIMSRKLMKLNILSRVFVSQHPKYQEFYKRIVFASVIVINDKKILKMYNIG